MKYSLRRILPGSVRSKLSKSVWQQLSPSWKLPSGLTVRIKSSAEWAIYNDIFVDGEYDTAIDMVVSSLEPDPLVLDIGASVGYFSLRFADRWFKRRGKDGRFLIIGIEGCPTTYAELRERMDQADLADLCRFHLGLAGKRDGESHISASSFHVANSIIGARGGFQVPFINLSSLVSEDRQISLLKCDIEGAEEMFLENYPELLKRVKRAVIELHPEKCDVSRCLELLKSAGLFHHANVRQCGAFRVDVFVRDE